MTSPDAVTPPVALVRRPGPRLAEGLVTHIDRVPVDLDQARAQWRGYVDALTGAGWQVVGSDNWYGTIPASTVYFPPRLKSAAAVLAKDIGIGRVQPAISPMRLDRLTVILTADFA